MMEIEVKLRAGSPEDAREKLARAGASEAGPRQFEDNRLYDDDAGTLLARRMVLRLRTSGGRHLVTFKTELGHQSEREGAGRPAQDEQYKVRVEHETAVGDPEAFDRLLQGLGYRPRWRYQKYRQSFRLAAVHSDLHIELDETPLGTFIELEGEREAIDAAARRLGFDARAYVTKTYRDLQEEATGSSNPGDLVFT